MLLDLSFITSAQIIIPVKKILSENILYRPTVVYGKGTGKRKMFFHIDNDVREYKDNIKEVCESSDFHTFLKEIKEAHQNLVIVASYLFKIPFEKFFVSHTEDFSRLDVTNMVKAVEDSVLGEVIDDKYVLESTVKKAPMISGGYVIEASFEFYDYNVVVDEKEKLEPRDFSLVSQLEELLNES